MSPRYDFLAQLNALDMALDERKRYLASTGQLTPQEDYGISLAQQSNAARARAAGVGGPMLNEPDRPANVGVLPSGFADWGRDTTKRAALAGTGIARGANTMLNRGEQTPYAWKLMGLEEQLRHGLPSTPQTQESGIAKATGTVAESGWMVPTAAAGSLIGGPYGAAVGAFVPSYLREYQGWFDEAVQGGMPRQQASDWAHVYAAPSAAIEALPLGVTGAVGRMAKPAIAPMVKQLLGVGKTGLGESTEEAGQSVWSDVVHGIAHDPSRLDPRRMASNAWEGAKQAFTPGAIFGATGLRRPPPAETSATPPNPLADANARAVAEKTSLEAQKEAERQAQEAQAQAMAPQVQAEQQQAQQQAAQAQQAQEAQQQAYQQSVAAAQAAQEQEAFQANVLDMHGKRPDRLFEMLYQQQQIPESEVDPADAAKLQLALGAELEHGTTVGQWFGLEAKRRSEAKWREDRGPAPEVMTPGAPVRIVKALTSQDKGLVGKLGEVERVFGEEAEPYVEVRLEDGSRQIVRAIDVDHAPADVEPGLKAPEPGVVEEIPTERPPARPRLVKTPAPTEPLPAPQPIQLDERPSPVATPPVGRLPRQAGEGSRIASLGFSGTPVAGYTPGVTPESVAEEAVKPLDAVAKKQPAPPATNLLGPPIREAIGKPEKAPETRGGPTLEPGDIVTDGTRKGTVIGPGPEVQWEDGKVSKAKPESLRLVPEEVAAPASSATTPSQESSASSPTAQPTQPAATRSRNRIVTWDRYQNSRERLRESLRRTNAGIDPTMLGHLAVIGGYHLEHTAREFVAWSEAVIKSAGEWARPHLQATWDKLQSERAGKTDEVIRPVVEPTSTAPLTEFGPGQKLQISLGKQGVREVKVVGVETDAAGKQRVKYWRWSNSQNRLLEESKPLDSFRSAVEHARYSRPFFQVPKDQAPASAELLLGDQPMEEINPFVNSPEGSQEADPFVKVSRDKFLADPYAWMWTMERTLAKEGGPALDIVNWGHYTAKAVERIAAARAMEQEMAPLIAKLPKQHKAALRRHFNMLMGRIDIDEYIEKLRATKAQWIAETREAGQVRTEMDAGIEFMEAAQAELEKMVGWNDEMRKQHGRQRYSPSLFLLPELEPIEAVWRKYNDGFKDLHEQFAGKGSAGRIKNHAPQLFRRDVRRRMHEKDSRQMAVLRAITAERIWREGKGTISRQESIEKANAELDEKGPMSLRRKMGSFEEQRHDAIPAHWIDWTDEHLHDYFRNAARSIVEWEGFGRLEPDGKVKRSPKKGMERAIAAIRYGQDGEVGKPEVADLAENYLQLVTGTPFATDVTEKGIRKGLSVLVNIQYLFKIFGSTMFTIQNAMQTMGSSFMSSPVSWGRSVARAFNSGNRGRALQAGAWEGADTPSSWDDLQDSDMSSLVRYVTGSSLRAFINPQERINNYVSSIASAIDANTRLDIIRRGGWRAKTHRTWLGSQYGITESELARAIEAGHWEVPAEHVTKMVGAKPTVMDKIMQEGAIRANPRGGPSAVPTSLANKGIASAMLRPLKTFVINRMNQQMHAVKADPLTVIPKIITIDIIQGEVLALANKLLFNRERESDYEEDWKKRLFWRFWEDLTLANTFGLLSRPMYLLDATGWLGPTMTLPADIGAAGFQIVRSLLHEDVKKDKWRISPFTSDTQRLAGESIFAINKQVRMISEATRGYKFLFSEKRDVRRTMDNARQAARFYQKSTSGLDERFDQEVSRAFTTFAPSKFRTEVNRVVESLEKGDPLEIQEAISGALTEIVRFQDGTNEERLKAAIGSLRGSVMNRAPLGLLSKDTKKFTPGDNEKIREFAAWAAKTDKSRLANRGDTEAMLQSHAAYTQMFATQLRMFSEAYNLTAE